MEKFYTFELKSNDGTKTLSFFNLPFDDEIIIYIYVTSTGIKVDGFLPGISTLLTYEYSGSSSFLGVSTFADEAYPKYPIGNVAKFTINKDTDDVFYIVEGEPDTVSTVITYNDNIIALAPRGKTVTLPCSGKVMKSDIVIKIGR